MAETEILEVQFPLPAKARLDLTEHRSLAVAPCFTVNRERSGAQHDAEIARTFQQHLERLVRRHSGLRIVELGYVDYPTVDIPTLSQASDFWRRLGERARVDLILSCSIDFELQDQSGYRTGTYTSPFDGRSQTRRVLVEEVGIQYDIVLQVYDGGTGDLLLSDNFRDFQQSESSVSADSLFVDLYTVEDHVIGYFAPRKVEAVRALFAN